MMAEPPPPAPPSNSDPEQPQTTSEPESSHKDAGSSGTATDPNFKSPLELAEDLIVKGSVAVKDGDFGEAIDCFSRALEIRHNNPAERSESTVVNYTKPLEPFETFWHEN